MLPIEELSKQLTDLNSEGISTEWYQENLGTGTKANLKNSNLAAMLEHNLVRHLVANGVEVVGTSGGIRNMVSNMLPVATPEGIAALARHDANTLLQDMNAQPKDRTNYFEEGLRYGKDAKIIDAIAQHTVPRKLYDAGLPFSYEEGGSNMPNDHRGKLVSTLGFFIDITDGIEEFLGLVDIYCANRKEGKPHLNTMEAIILEFTKGYTSETLFTEMDSHPEREVALMRIFGALNKLKELKQDHQIYGQSEMDQPPIARAATPGEGADLKQAM